MKRGVNETTTFFLLLFSLVLSTPGQKCWSFCSFGSPVFGANAKIEKIWPKDYDAGSSKKSQKSHKKGKWDLIFSYCDTLSCHAFPTSISRFSNYPMGRQSVVLVLVLLCAATAFARLIPVSHDTFEGLTRRTRREVNTTALLDGQCRRLWSRSDEVVVSWVNCGSFSEPSVFYDENCGANSQFLVTCTGECLVSISGVTDDGEDWGCSTVGGPRSHYHVVTSQVNCLYEDHTCEATSSGTFFGFGAESGVGQLRDSTDCGCHSDCVVSEPVAFSSFCTPTHHSMEFHDPADGLRMDASLLPSLGSGDWTIELWFKVQHVPGEHEFLFSMNGGFSHAANLYITDNGEIRGLFSGGNNYYQFTDTKTYGDGQWHHLAVVRSAGPLTFYVDAVAVPTSSNGALDATLIDAVGTNSYIGEQMVGKIDNVRIWNVAKTQAQIATDKDLLFCEDTNSALVFCAEFEGDAVAATQISTGQAMIVDGTPTQSVDVPF